MLLNPMAEASLVLFESFEAPNGVLCVYESGKHVPFDVQRVFTICAKSGQVRGEHAHKRCTQLLVCLVGQILVHCENGQTSRQYLLNNMATGLLIPPGVWAKQKYLVDDSVLMALCDRSYESEDYIRDYYEFRSFLGLKESK